MLFPTPHVNPHLPACACRERSKTKPRSRTAIVTPTAPLLGQRPSAAAGASASWSLGRLDGGSALDPLLVLLKGGGGALRRASSAAPLPPPLSGPELGRALGLDLASPLAARRLGPEDEDGGMPAPRTGGAADSDDRVVFGVAQARNQRPYMEDRHSLVQRLRPLSATGGQLAGAAAADDGVERSWAAVFDGHNGSRAAEEAAGVQGARGALQPLAVVPCNPSPPLRALLFGCAL